MQGDFDHATLQVGGALTRAFQPRIVCLVEELQRVDLRNFRALSSDDSWQLVVARASLPTARRLTEQAHGMVVELSRFCASILWREEGAAKTPTLPPAFLSFERSMDSAVQNVRARSSIQAVDDVAFLVSIELRQRLDRLDRVEAWSSPISVIGECDGALRRVRKGIGAVDAAIASFERRPPILAFASELEHALRVRRAYARFRSYVVRTDASDPSGALRGVVGRICALSEGHVAPLLRVGDRLRIFELRERIEAWLRDPARSVADGERLQQDVVAFAETLARVNRRQELVEHDLAAIRTLMDDDTLSTSKRVELCRSLEGSDPDFDLVLHAADPSRPERVAVLLAPLVERLAADARSAR